MNACLSRFVLLSTVLCVGPAVVDRLARADEKPADAAGALPQLAAQAILRALGLSDTAPAPPAPGQSVLTEMLSATAVLPPTAASTQAGTSGEPATVTQTAGATRQVLQILGLMPADTQAAPAVPPAATHVVAAPEPAAQAPAPNLAAEVPLESATASLAVPAAATAPPTLPAMAEPAPAQQQLAQRTLVALDESALDTMRGGFIGDGGLKISFGIERAVYVNGNLVTTTSLNLSELGTLSAGKAAAMNLPEVGNRIALIQNGAGNTVLSNLGPAAIGTVIQNTLDGQKIQTLTTINATANSLGVLKSIEAQRNLRSAITDSLRR
ncbi:hypothetical protein [uncultured Azohydromonas sp.]|jgi:hypothetical protein|uniref:hypothetical protein n=1 Tax=uncultured Azohydromonas sp. TaxID=487342 RepID=UPI002639FFAA|nr:hypothetical protein [uncultured Azohydromonas sp.]